MTDPATGQTDFVILYRYAFAHYSAHALWNKRLIEEPTPADALVVARALRIEGDREARKLAEQIEQACRSLKYRQRLTSLATRRPGRRKPLSFV